MRTHVAGRVVMCCGLLAALGAGGGGRAKGGAPVLPEAVKATVAKQLAGGAIQSFEEQAEGKRHVFLVDVKKESGEVVTVLASGRGQYLGLVEEDADKDDSGDTFVDPETAPTAVKEAIGKQFGKEEIDSLFLEAEGERFVFCAEQTVKKVTKWVSFSLQGELMSIETEVAVKDLPKAVAAQMKWQITSASVVDDKEKKSTYYVVDVLKGKEKRELTVTPEGKVTGDEAAEEEGAAKP